MNKFYKIQKHLFFLFLVIILVNFSLLKSQNSPSYQSKIIVPSILSGCTVDTMEIHYTNLSGPSCTAGGAPLLATYAVTIPGGAEASYVSGSLSSNATFVSYASNVLTYTVATPSLGVTTKVKFLVSTSCNIVNVVPLPRLDVTVNYPTGVTPSSETWLSSKMNVGLGQLSMRSFSAWHGVLSQSIAGNRNTSIVGFAANTGDYIDFHNTGFGALEEIEYNVVIDDSLYYFYNGSAYNNVPVNPNQFQYFYSFTPGYATCNNCNVWLTNTNTTMTISTYGGKRWYKFKLSPSVLGGNGQLDPGEILRFPLYLRAPNTCTDDQQIKRWINYKCADGSGSCQKSDTFYTTYKISAGQPIISVANAQVQQWNGCQNRTARFVFRNTGIPDATRPEVSTAYDLDLSVNLGGKLTISNLTFAGGTSVPTAQTFPGSTSVISWNIKDQLNFDPDGAGGLTDLDGDGFYDELRPGDSVVVTFNYTVDCDLACGVALNYNITGVSSFTDYCRKLNGAGSVPIYRFGFEQTAPVSQITPLPNYGTMGLGQKRTRRGEFTFNYRHWGLDTSQATVKLRINYSKSNQVVEPIRFLGRSMTLSEFTLIGAGTTDTTNGNYDETVDKDSALEYTLTKAEIRALLNNVRDSLSYAMTHIACDSFQHQKNTDGFQILFQINTNNCPPVPCFLDLACNKAFAYNVSEGCGSFPCYNTIDTIYRNSPWGHTDETQSTGVTPTPGGFTNFYEGDTLTWIKTSALSGNVPLMEPIGAAGNGTTNGFYQYWSFNYNKPTNVDIYNLTQPHFQFLEDISRVRVYDTTGGVKTLLYNVPLKFKHFYGHNGFATQNGDRSTLLLYDNITDNPGYTSGGLNNSIPGTGLGDHWCNNNTWVLDASYCPYLDHRYFSTNTIMEQLMVSEDGQRVSERYRLQYEMALIDAGITFDPGSTKYLWEVETKWRINPDYPHTNTADFLIRSYMLREGNGVTFPYENRTYVGSCSEGKGIGSVATKDIFVEGGRANYEASCGLNIHNKLFFHSSVGDYFPSEFRVPFKLDSFVVVLPGEYATTTTSPTSLSGSNGGPANSIQMVGTTLGTGYTGRILFTNNTTNSGTSYTDFPRINDADGLQTAWDVLYSLYNANDNFIIQSYKVPVVYYLIDEFGKPFTLIDTFIISESQPVITIEPLGGTVTVEDGGSCKNSYMDVLVSNNTIYGASNVFIAAISSTNTTVKNISDVGTVADPIIAADTNHFGTNNIYAELGGMAAGDRRIVRIEFNSSVCEDSIKVISNFGCNYPVSRQPTYPSSTIDSAFIVYNSIAPLIMSAPIDGNKTVTNLCDMQNLEVELRNVKNPNLTNLKIGFKLPASVEYVTGSAQIAYPSNTYVNAPTVNVISPDSIEVDISSDVHLANSCGLVGADEALPPGVTIAQNVVKVRLRVDFIACPVGTSEEIFYSISGTNFCGTIAKSEGVFNLIYSGNSTPSRFTCRAQQNSKVAVCASAGEISHVKDPIYIKNVGTGVSSSLDTMELTVGIDTGRLELLNFSVASPFSLASTTINAQGRPVVKIAIPAGLAINDSFLLQLEYDVKPKVNNICNNPTLGCADISHSAVFYSVPSLTCSSPSLTCPIAGRTIKGDGFVPRDITCCASLGNFVWLDNDKDGTQDVGEPGVAGVNIDLYNAGPDGIAGNGDDEFVGTTKTDAYGKYLFDNLIPDNYYLKITPPINYDLTTQTNTVDSTAGAATADLGSDFNPNTNTTYVVNLREGENDLRIDAGLIFDEPTTASIGDKVWFDEDNDGIQDVTEGGLAGVTVTLYNSSGQPVATTITDANGNYLFTNLAPGDYSVGITLPMGTKFSPQNSGANDNVDSDVSPTTGRTANVTLSAGQNIRDLDIGVTLIDPTKASLGDRVWYDTDQDGIQDPGEIGVAGVEVQLLDDFGNVLATTYTDAFGNYMFTNLDAGIYRVDFVEPSGYVFSPARQSTDFTEDSDADPATGKSKPIYLQPGDKFLGIDAGIYQVAPAGTASLGDKVWYDVDNDGIQDANETGVAGITVTLYNSVGTPIATTTTDIDGNYKFINLPAGDYSVGFSNLPPEYSMTSQTTGTADGSDANPSTGRTPNITLTAGQYYPDLDLGITKGTAAGLGSIGNKVWNDVNQDGIQDNGEVGVPGVTVYLSKDLNGDGDFNDPGEMFADSTVTNGSGNYIFTNLPAGNYQVTFKTSSYPNGFVGTTANAGADDAMDSDGVSNGTNHVSQIIPLGKGEDNMTIDMGIYVNNPALGSIGNFVWIDTNGDGIQDPGEEGLPGVQVTLYDGDGKIVAIMTTDANGYYLFDGLPAGDYSIGISQLPDGFDISPTGAGTSLTDNNIDPVSKRSAVISLAPGEDNMTLDAGLTPTKAVLGNYVWRDNDGNGVQDAGEPGIAGVTVTLYDGSGNAVASTMTDADGKYLFTNLDPGTYSVGFSTIPSGLNWTVKDANTGTDGTDSDVDPLTGRTAPVTLNAGDVNLTLDAGLAPAFLEVGNYVWMDEDNNGVQDPNELAISGVLVKIYSVGGDGAKGGGDDVLLGTTITKDGKYLFTDLTPGTYYVEFTNTFPTFPFTAPDNTADGADSDADLATGESAVFTLTNANNYTLDAGIFGNIVALSIDYEFTAVKYNNTKSLLQWMVISDNIEVREFVIFRATDGVNYKELAKVKANHLTDVYKWIDENPVIGLNYYRINIITSTQEILTTIRIVQFNNLTNQSVNIYPNPTQNIVKINPIGLENQKAEIKVTDITGKVIKVIVLDNLNQLYELDLSEFESGVYNIHVSTENSEYSERIILNKNK